MPSSRNSVLGLVDGASFVAIGVLGFFVNPLLVFTVNAAQNTLHLAVGAALLCCAFAGGAARCNAIVGAVLLSIGIAGLFIVSTEHNVLAVNGASNALHFASAACLLAAGLGTRR